MLMAGDSVAPFVHITPAKEIIRYDSLGKTKTRGSVADIGFGISPEGYYGNYVWLDANTVLLAGELNETACYTYSFSVKDAILK